MPSQPHLNDDQEPDHSKQLIIEKILEFGISAKPMESKRRSSDDGN